MELIDKALDENDKEEFQRLSEYLNNHYVQ
jgi:uncharacterized protein YpiB (UPF0302 family)